MARTKDFDENEVLAKAIQLFWLKGYNATSMQDLVDTLGISRSSLYDTYTDKHTLFIKALQRYQDAAATKINNILSQNLSAKEVVKNLLEYAITELTSDQQQKGCFMVNAGVEVAPHDQEVSQMICQSDQLMEEAFYKVITKGQSNGEIQNKHNARALARFIFNSLKGMRVSAKTTTDKNHFKDIIL